MMNPIRIYEGISQPFAYEPTRDKFKIVDAGEKGQGVVSLAHFNIGDVVFAVHGRILDHQTLFTLDLQNGTYLEDDRIYGKLLHSCDPNVMCDLENRRFVAVKEIKPHDYIAMDYELTENELTRSFVCRCGSANCRGLIRGRKFQN